MMTKHFSENLGVKIRKNTTFGQRKRKNERERERERERKGTLRCLISSFYKTSTESIVHKKRAHLSTIVNRNRRYIIIIKSGRDHSANYRNLSTHTRAYTCTKKKWHIHHTHIHIYAKKKRRNIDNSKLYIERTLSNKFYRVVSGKLVIVFMRPSARKRYNNMIIQKKRTQEKLSDFRQAASSHFPSGWESQDYVRDQVSQTLWLNNQIATKQSIARKLSRKIDFCFHASAMVRSHEV